MLRNFGLMIFPSLKDTAGEFAKPLLCRTLLPLTRVGFLHFKEMRQGRGGRLVDKEDNTNEKWSFQRLVFCL
jgi:hypothetical protein